MPQFAIMKLVPIEGPWAHWEARVDSVERSRMPWLASAGQLKGWVRMVRMVVHCVSGVACAGGNKDQGIDRG
jgi:hypothetical protein